jgi:hypothetical protein
MKAVVVKPYQRPYENPIAVKAGERIEPDFNKESDIDGWVWCVAKDGRAGWTPRRWLVRSGDEWQVNRAFNAIELTVEPGERLEIAFEESGFFWAGKDNGQAGWVPCEHVSLLNDRSRG